MTNQPLNPNAAAEPDEPPYDPTVPITPAERTDSAQPPAAPTGYPATPPPNPNQKSEDSPLRLKASEGQGSQKAEGNQPSQSGKGSSKPPANPVTAKARRPFPVWIWWIVALLAVASAGFFLFFWRGTMTVTITPPQATVSIAGVTGTGAQTRTLPPGTYALHAEAPGFLPFDQDVTLGRHAKEQIDVTLQSAPVPIQLSGQVVQFLALDAEQSSLLYLEPATKTIYRLRFDDPTKPIIDPITPNRFEQIRDLIWSPDRQLALLREGGVLSLYDFNRYDLVNQTTTDWPSEVKAIDWRPDGAKVAYFLSNPTTGERTLVRATKDNEEIERIFNFANTVIMDPTLSWSPDAKQIAIVEKNVFLFDVFSKTLRQLSVPGPIKAVRWSPSSDRLLFETESGQLGLIGTGGEASRLAASGPLTRAVFSHDGQSLIHASGRGSTFKLVRINLGTLDQTVISTPAAGELAADNLLLGKDDAQLFFTSNGLPHVLDLVPTK